MARHRREGGFLSRDDVGIVPYTAAVGVAVTARAGRRGRRPLQPRTDLVSPPCVKGGVICKANDGGIVADNVGVASPKLDKPRRARHCSRRVVYTRMGQAPLSVCRFRPTPL